VFHETSHEEVFFMPKIEEIIPAQDPGRSMANMRLFQEVVGDIARERIIPKKISASKNPRVSYAGTEGGKNEESFLLDFDWHFPPSHPLEPAAAPPGKEDNPNRLDSLSSLRTSEERLENLQRVRNFTKESVLESLRETSRGKVSFSFGQNASPQLVLKDPITGHILWQAPLEEARNTLLRGTPLKGLNYSINA